MSISITPFLRNVLLLDAVVSGGAAVLMVAGASLLSPMLALPAGLLFWAGLALAPFVAMLVAIARRPSVARMLLIDIIAINVLWVAGSFGLLLSGAVAPSLLGVLFVTAQALAVAAFAALQLVGLRRAVMVAA